MKPGDISGDGKWFHRGKEARANNQPRDIVDARMSDANRRAFQAGWDEEECRRSPAHEAVTAARLAEFKKQMREVLGK
jgi:hypothetical protein